jgi:hypothetical protein
MKWALLLLLCLSALPVQAQAPPSVSARWLTPTTAEVAWSGPGGAGSCVWRVRPYHPTYHQEPTCNRESGVLFLGNDAIEGDRYELRSTDGVTVLASAELGPAPRWEQRLVLVIRPDLTQ